MNTNMTGFSCAFIQNYLNISLKYSVTKDIYILYSIVKLLALEGLRCGSPPQLQPLK